MTDDTTRRASGPDEARIFGYLCDFFSRTVVFPEKFDPDDQMNHTSAPSRALSMELTSYLAKHGLVVQPVREKYTLLDVDQVYFELLADLKKWGAIESWGVTDNGDDSVLVFTMLGRETVIQPGEVEDTVSGLVDGWLAARARSCEPHQLHQEERDQLARFNRVGEPHNEDQAAIDHLERPAPAGEDDPDRGGEDD